MQYPDNAATIFYGQNLTYREITKQVNAVAATLQTMGVVKGDRVALMLPNCPQFVIAYFAILRVGAIVANVNPLYTPREIGQIINETGASTLFTLDMGAPGLDKARQAGQLPSLKQIVAVRLADYMSDVAHDRYLAGQAAQGIAAPEVRNWPTFRTFPVSPFRRRPVWPASPSRLQRLPDAVSPRLQFSFGLWLTSPRNCPILPGHFPNVPRI